MSKPPSTRSNVVANFAGRGLVAIITFAATPIYIRLLGIEAYGLIGVYTTLTVLFGVLDLGLTPAITRELALMSCNPARSGESRTLVRTLETVYWIVAAAVGLGLVALSPLLSHHWVHSIHIPVRVVQVCLAIMGLIFCAQWPDSFYAGGLAGLQQQILVNRIRVAVAVSQAAGSIAILLFVSRTVQAFFVWQAVIFAVQTSLLAFSLWRSLPRAAEPVRFRWNVVAGTWRFAAGLTGITLLSTVLTQSDKIILSKTLSLRDFGYYMFAFTVASVLAFAVGPIYQAVFPRLTQRASENAVAAVSALYHRSCQLVAALVMPGCVTLALFSQVILLAYTRSADTAAHVKLLLSLVSIGTALNCIMVLPLGLQLAYGWTRLSLYKNVIAIVLYVPILLFSVSRFGAIGGAVSWIAVNGAYVLFEVPIMHNRLKGMQPGRWYWRAVALPLLLSLAVALPLVPVLSRIGSSSLKIGLVVLSCLLEIALCAALTDIGRERLQGGIGGLLMRRRLQKTRIGVEGVDAANGIAARATCVRGHD